VDSAPEFALAGAGLGSVVLDATRAPSKIETDTGTHAVTFRYWLTGRFADTGNLTLTFLANSWSVSQTGPTATGSTLGATFLDVVFPVIHGTGWTIVDGSVTGNEITIFLQLRADTL